MRKVARTRGVAGGGRRRAHGWFTGFVERSRSMDEEEGMPGGATVVRCERCGTKNRVPAAMLIMKGKDILARQTGAAPEPVLRDWLAKVLQLPAA